MVRYFILAVITFILYWGIKGIARRFMKPPAAPRRSTRAEAHGPARADRIDYSKVRDASYRDVDS